MWRLFETVHSCAVITGGFTVWHLASGGVVILIGPEPKICACQFQLTKSPLTASLSPPPGHPPPSTFTIPSRRGEVCGLAYSYSSGGLSMIDDMTAGPHASQIPHVDGVRRHKKNIFKLTSAFLLHGMKLHDCIKMRKWNCKHEFVNR